MTSEQKAQIQLAMRKAPKSVWGYWPFLVPTIMVIVGFAIQIVLVIYLKTKIPDLQVLFQHGKRIQPVGDSELVQRFVLVTGGAIVVNLLMFTQLARLTFRHVNLLKAAAKDLGIEEL